MIERHDFALPDDSFLLFPENMTYLSGQNTHIKDTGFFAIYGSLFVLFLLGVIIVLPSLSANNNSVILPNLLRTAICLSPFLATLIYLLGRQVIRNRKLEREGTIIVGKIINCVGTSDRAGYLVRVEYEFVSPENRTYSRREQTIRSDLRNRPLPTPGTAVTVLYVNPKLYRVL